MHWRSVVRIAFVAITCLVAFGGAAPAVGAIVRFSTTLGEIDMRLYEAAAPLSVANFLGYVNTDRYDGTLVHRSVPGFVIQGGGFSLAPDIFSTTPVTTDPPIQNEFNISNTRGTIAFAKISGDPDSATSQWFVNLADNSSNLDLQNGGFAVFGRLLGGSMSVVDAIAALERVNAGGVFSNLPVTDLDLVLANQTVTPSEAVLVHSALLLDLPAADYDFNGIVDAADREVWLSTLGSTVDAAADGNGDGVVDEADLLIWKAAVPEPAALPLLALAAIAALAVRCGRDRSVRE